MNRPQANAIAVFVSQLPGVYYTRSQVAAALGVTSTGVREAGRRRDELKPSCTVDFRGEDLRLYTEEDVARLHEYFHRFPAGHRGPGRPRLWTLEEELERRRKKDAARHQYRRAEELRLAGDLDRAARHAEQARRLSAELEQSRRLRIEQRRKQRPAAILDPGSPDPELL